MAADTAPYDIIDQRIISGGEMHGINMCVMMPPILIVSIGLNMNSTAVTIGAMLLSLLMGRPETAQPDAPPSTAWSAQAIRLPRIPRDSPFKKMYHLY